MTREGTTSPMAVGMAAKLARKVDTVTQGRRGTVSLTPMISRVMVKAVMEVPIPPALANTRVRP